MLSIKVTILVLCFTFITVSGDKSKVSKYHGGDNRYEIRLVSSSPTVDYQNESRYTPVVFWHGMGDTAFGSINLERIALEKQYPGMQIFSIQIGNNVIEDELSGYFVNVNYQIDQACEKIKKNDIIKRHGSFNAIGFSQGCQFLRGLIERCDLELNGIRVKNFISLGGQHQGVFGLPNCDSDKMGMNFICNHIRELLTNAAYEKNVQDNCVQAEYWHDPYREQEYKEKNIFLADINNELYINVNYKHRLSLLENMVLVEFLQDQMVIPRESSLFGFYAPNQTDKIIRMEESRLYKEDRIGLSYLNEQNRLKQLRVNGNHLQYSMKWFMREIASIYLDN